MSERPHGDVIHYLMEFMKFLCGFALMLAFSITVMYFSTSNVQADVQTASQES